MNKLITFLLILAGVLIWGLSSLNGDNVGEDHDVVEELVRLNTNELKDNEVVHSLRGQKNIAVPVGLSANEKKVIPSSNKKLRTEAEQKKHIQEMFANTYENEVKKLKERDENNFDSVKNSVSREHGSLENQGNQGRDVKTFDNEYEKMNQKVDILWVIDDSGSMTKHLDLISTKINIFIDEFVKKNVSFQMGVMNTSLDLLHEGNALNSEVYRRNKSEFIGKFNDIFQLKSFGSGEEKGLAATLSFLQNSGERFLRPKSKFIVIVISDEDDQSISNEDPEKLLETDSFMKTVSQFRSGKDFELYSIISFPPKVVPLAGLRYAEVSYQSKGLVSDIEGDFHQMLLNIGGRIIKSVERGD